MRHRAPLSIALLTAGTLALSAVSVAAQDEVAPAATVAEANAGLVSGPVTLVGAVLWQIDDEEHVFSDGTDVTDIDIDTSSVDPDVPLLSLITITGTVASDEIDVSSWEPLPIMMPAVIRTPEEAMEAFVGWIVNQNSQEAVGEQE